MVAMRLLGLLVLAGCARHAPRRPPDDASIAGPPTTCNHVPSTWVEREVGRDRVRFSAGLDADGARAAAGLTATRDALSAVLAVPTDATPPATLWLTTASPQIGSGVAMTVSDSAHATVFVYSPSCDPDPRPRQFEKTLLQELSGEYLEAATLARPDGWVFYHGPPWFVQGAEEWFSLRIHDPPADLVAAGLAVAAASPDGAIAVNNGQVTVENPYRDGLALVGWISATHDPDVLSRILASDAPTFDAALNEVIGLDGVGVVGAYRAWREALR